MIPGEPPALAGPGVAALAGPAVASLAADFRETRLRWDPVYATIIGDRRFDDRLEDRTPAARAARPADPVVRAIHCVQIRRARRRAGRR